MWAFLYRIKYILLILILFSLIFILFKGYSIETPYFKIGKVPDTLFIEKEVKIPSDTIYKERIVTKYVETPKKVNSTKVKKANTEILVNDQPANINSGTNSGIIGNNNTINNLKEPDIALSEKLKKDIIALIEIESKKITAKEKNKISIGSMAGSNKAMKLSIKIKDFLEKSGYIVNGIGMQVSSSTEQGIFIDTRGDEVHISVNII